MGCVILTEDVQEQQEEERHDYGITSFPPLAAGALVPFVIRTGRAVAGCDTARGLLPAESVALALGETTESLALYENAFNLLSFPGSIPATAVSSSLPGHRH